MERMMAGHTGKRANNYIAGPVVESDSDGTLYKRLPLSMSVIRQPLDVRSEIERVLAYLGVVSNADAEAMDENRMAESTNTPQSYIVKAIESTL